MLDDALKIIAKGFFIEECANRFLCKVKLPELGQTLCYVPSSARLTNLIKLENKTVCVTELPKGNCAKLSLLARQDGQSYTLLNLSLVNELILRALKQEKRYQNVEMQINKLTAFGYRSDILAKFKLEECFEVKSLLSDDAVATFPSIKGERAFRQLEQILSILRDGKRFTYIIALLNSKIKAISLSEKDLEYNELLHRCFRCGLKIRVYRLNWLLDKQPRFVRARNAERSIIESLQGVSNE